MVADRGRVDEFVAGVLAQVDAAVVLTPVHDEHGALVDFDFRGVNDAAADYLQVGEDELVGARYLDRYPVHRASGFFDRLVAVYETGEVLAIDDQPLVSSFRPEGTTFDVRAARVDHSVVVSWRDNSARVEAARRLTESEQRYRLLAENASDMVVAAEVDGPITWVSPSAKAVLGYDADELIGTRPFDLIHPDDQARIAAEAAPWDGSEAHVFTARVRTATGDHRWISARVKSVVAEDGTVIGRVGTWHDIEDEKAARDALAESEERFRTAFDAAPIGIALVDLDRRFLAVNPSLCELLGRTREWLLAHRVADVLDPIDNETDIHVRTQLLRNRRGSDSVEKRLLRPDGSIVWVQHVVAVHHDHDGHPVGYISQFLDITDTVRIRDRLNYQATHDRLTKVGNRQELDHSLGEFAAVRQGDPIGLLFIDVDGLKAINDTLGHAAGDDALVEVARRIQRCTRREDVVTRFGGDEFVVVLPRIAADVDLEAVAENVLRVIREPFSDDGHPIVLSVSIGGALLRGGEDATDALDRADAALYRAKDHGRDRYEPAAPST